MKLRVIPLALLIVLLGTVLSFADDPNLGTWKLNEAKSKFGPNSSKNHTVVYQVDGESVKVTVDGTAPDGSATHNEWTGKFDGKDYPVTGDATSDTRAYTHVNAHTLSLTAKKNGKVTMTGKVEISADGKHRTVTTSGTDATGKSFHTTAVYDKQ
jgi:hypothetical protein